MPIMNGFFVATLDSNGSVGGASALKTTPM